ncbi:MAG: hypothetical protein ACR2RL_22185, partial [Gammaproteobacteria bacterium]
MATPVQHLPPSRGSASRTPEDRVQDVRAYMHALGARARAAAPALARAATGAKNEALSAIAAAIERDAG